MLRDVVRIWCTFFYFRYITSCILVLWLFWHTLYLYLLYILLMYVLSPISPCVVSFLSLYTCFLYNVCNLLFLFHTKMSWWVLFKVFQKYRLSKSTCHKLFSCKVFQEFVLGYILLYSTTMNMSWVIFDFSHFSFVCCGFVTDCQKERLLGHMWFNVRNICQHFM